MAAKIFRINYKSDFILTLESDAGWMTPFCIKFWTGVPSRAFYAGWDGTTYTNCAPVAGEPTKLTVQFDDHHLPVGDLKLQIAYHFTVADFPNNTEDEVINPADITIMIDGEEYQVMLDFTGETAPEIQFSLPAYANEAQRIENELEREQKFAEMKSEFETMQQENEQAMQGAENVNAQLSGTILTITNRNGESVSKDVQGPRGERGEQGQQGDPGTDGSDGVGISSVVYKGTDAQGGNIYTITLTNGSTYDFTAPRGEQGIQGPAGQDGSNGSDGVGISSVVYKGTDAQGGNIYTITLTNGSTYDFTAPRGEQGIQGPQGPTGQQGPASPVNISLSGTVITFTNNQGVTSSLDVADALAPIIGDINSVLDNINGEVI